MTRIHQAALKTLAYADIFDYPLTKAEIKKWLIWQHKSPPPSLNSALKTFPKTNNYYHLPRRQAITKLRRHRHRFSKSKLKLAHRASRYLQLIPTIQLIAVTGALAMNNSDNHDDIDLMIITKTHSLWLTRLTTVLLLELLRLRRRPHTNPPNKICLNLFLDQSSLQLSSSQRNLYTAHEVSQIKPLFDRGQTYQKFLTANSWIKTYLPNAVKTTSPKQTPSSPRPSPPLEALAFKLQYLYMKPKITHEKVTLHSAFFHPRQTGKIILKQYHQKLTQLL